MVRLLSMAEVNFVVQSKKKSRKTRKTPHQILDRDSTPVLLDIPKVLRQIGNCEQELKNNSKFLTAALDSVEATFKETSIREIICLGIGRISSCSIAKHQLAFISILAKYFSIADVKFFDPVLSEAEKEVLQQLDFQILSENKEGKYLAEHPTLFYLPHCPKQITNNLLFENWSELHARNLFLICNSFKTIIENTPRRFLRPNAHFLLEISPFVAETEIENTFKFNDIFNDFSIHSFPNEKLKLAPSDFWTNKPEPNYKEEDLELIKNGSS